MIRTTSFMVRVLVTWAHPGSGKTGWSCIAKVVAYATPN